MGELFEGADQFLFGTLGLTLVAPGNSVQDLYDSADGQDLSGEQLVPQTRSIGAKELGREFSGADFFLSRRGRFHYADGARAELS